MKQIFAALAKFQSSIDTIEKGKEVSVKTKSGYTYKFKYADLAEIFGAIRQPLKDAGLAIIQKLDTLEDGTYITTMICHDSGEFLESKVRMDHKGQSVTDFGSCITYYRRYALSSMLGLVTDEDVDDIINHEEQKKDFQEVKSKKKAEPKAVPVATPRKITFAQAQDLTDRLCTDQVRFANMLSHYKVQSVNDLTDTQYLEICKILEKDIELNKKGEHQPT